MLLQNIEIKKLVDVILCQEVESQLPSRPGQPCSSAVDLQTHMMRTATPKLRATTSIIAEAMALLLWLCGDPHQVRRGEKKT